MTDTPYHGYRELDAGKRQIRILKIKSVSGEPGILAALKTVSLDQPFSIERPRYMLCPGTGEHLEGRNH